MPAKKSKSKKDTEPKKKKKKVTKKAKKPAAKKTRKKHAKKEVKKHIEKAAEQIPSIISEELNKTQQKRSVKKEKQIDQEHFMYDHGRERKKKQLVLFGVLCLTAVVLAMWLWNARIFIYQVQEQSGQSSADSIWKNVKDDFQEVLDTVRKDEEERAATIEKVKEQIETVESEQKLRDSLENIVKEKSN